MTNPSDAKKLEQIRQYVESAHLSMQEARALLDEMTGGVSTNEALNRARHSGAILTSQDGSNIVEGVFDGQNMMGPDGKQYSIPANYSSKSKLVEGDLLKLTITANGSFIYKQIGPIERSRVRGKLIQDSETEEWRVQAAGKSYKVLLASITYFKGDAGNDVVILLPKDKPSTWAAVENIIHAGEEGMYNESTSAVTDVGASPDVVVATVPSTPVLLQQTKDDHLPVPALTILPMVEPHSAVPAVVVSPTTTSTTVQFDDDKDEFEEI